MKEKSKSEIQSNSHNSFTTLEPIRTHVRPQTLCLDKVPCESMVPCYGQDDLFKPCNLCKTRYPGMTSQTGLTKVPPNDICSRRKYCYQIANILQK